MRISAFVTILVTLFLFSQEAIAQMATSDAAPLNNREIRRRDNQVCIERAQGQNILRRNQAEFVRTCMADRQGERRAAQRKETTERRRLDREMAAEERAEIQKVRDRERREQLEKEAAKRADCTKQANNRNLRRRERRNFIKNCVAG